MNHQPRIFISSVQKELAAERCALAGFIKGDPLLQRYFDPFLFEDLPATDRRADDVYLDEVDRRHLNSLWLKTPHRAASPERPTNASANTLRVIMLPNQNRNAKYPSREL